MKLFVRLLRSTWAEELRNTTLRALQNTNQLAWVCSGGFNIAVCYSVTLLVQRIQPEKWSSVLGLHIQDNQIRFHYWTSDFVSLRLIWIQVPELLTSSRYIQIWPTVCSPCFFFFFFRLFHIYFIKKKIIQPSSSSKPFSICVGSIYSPIN